MYDLFFIIYVSHNQTCRQSVFLKSMNVTTMKHLLLMAAMLAIVLAACEDPTPNDDNRQLIEDIEINPAHEQNPPIATNIFIEVLEEPDEEGNTIKLIATFEEGAIEGNYLAMLLGDEKVVLRDDGEGADIEAEDGAFSLNLREDVEALREELAQRQEIGLTDERRLSFKNRAQRPERLDLLREFDMRSIEAGNRVLVPRGILTVVKSLSDQKKTLMITDLRVVEDTSRTFNPCTGVGNPNGVWTFGAIMRQMASPDTNTIANNAQVSAFVRNWLDTWNSPQTINGELLNARPAIQNLINIWESKSGVQPGGTLDMQFAPFKLIAIVNRLDLRGNSGYGFSDAGEGRLVFNVMDVNCNPEEFTVIFEYGINKRSCTAVKAFAQEWDNLKNLSLGSTAYNNALEAITNQFTQVGTNPTKPNQNSINQIRTNEIALDVPWELREFNLNTSGQLELVTVKQEPAVNYNIKQNVPDVQRLADFVNSNQLAIENNNYTVPKEVSLNTGAATPTTPFLGGKSHTIFPSTTHHWDGGPSGTPAFINSDQARHIFSLNTCSGCHGGETRTRFTHISPSAFGVEAQLSSFLTGTAPLGGVIDPAGRPTGASTVRNFHDLLRRENDLANLLANNCSIRPFITLANQLTHEPLRMTH